MSRTYRIKLGAEELTLHGNAIQLPIHLAAILPQEEMQALLRKQLEAAGWQPREGRLEQDLPQEDITAVVPEELDSLRIRIEQREAAVGSIPEEVRSRIEAGEVVSASEVNLEVSDSKVSQALTEARSRLNEVLGQVYKEAVLQKAEQLGTVESVQEQEGAQGTRIRITVQG